VPTPAQESQYVNQSAGRVRESQRYVGQSFRNTYEQTKLEAESLVDDSDLPTAILRPRIVVGDGATDWTPAFKSSTGS